MFRLIPLSLLLLSVVACAAPTTAEGEPVPTTTTTEGPTVTETPTVTEAPATTGARKAAEGPVAPDFALELGRGGTFRLSEEQDPVYLVFWAEW